MWVDVVMWDHGERQFFGSGNCVEIVPCRRRLCGVVYLCNITSGINASSTRDMDSDLSGNESRRIWSEWMVEFNLFRRMESGWNPGSG